MIEPTEPRELSLDDLLFCFGREAAIRVRFDREVDRIVAKARHRNPSPSTGASPPREEEGKGEGE